LGINDKAHDRATAFVGASSVDYPVDVVRRGIFDRTRPPLTCDGEERLIDGVRVVVLRVPAGLNTYSNTAGTATRRIGTECRPFSPEEQREVRVARGELDWSAGPSGAAISSLAPSSLELLRTYLAAAGHDELVRLRDRQLLDALRLVAADGTLTFAALVLMAPPDVIATRVPTYGYSYQYRPSMGREATSRFRQTRPILEAVETVLGAITTRSSVQPLNIRGGVQLQLADYPTNAVRELLVNGFIHRSYEIVGTVDVEHSPEHLIVTSPGALVAGITPENILVHPSTPRNRLLAEAVSRLQLAERTGQGVDRAYRELLRAGKQPPVFVDEQLQVRVVLRGGIGNDSFARYVADLPEELGTDVEVLLVLSELRNSRSLDAYKVAQLIQRAPYEAEEVLRRLTDSSNALLEPTKRSARSAHPKYRLRSTALAQLRRALAYPVTDVGEADRKVIEHIREFGYITNPTLRRLFDLHVYAARDMLNDLRKRKIIEKVGEARGGRGVRYGPGPAFPPPHPGS
jgi:ATP-dependent DNA helicase RecG